MDNKLTPMNEAEMMFLSSSTIICNDKLVLTTEQLAKVYKTDVDTIEMGFAENEERFKKGLHYYILEGEELEKFRDGLIDVSLVAKNVSRLYLWTVRGATRYCKILDTDVAWDVWKKLCSTFIESENKI